MLLHLEAVEAPHLDGIDALLALGVGALLTTWTPRPRDAGPVPADLARTLDRAGAVTLDVPPLRERAEDVAALATHFLRERTGDPSASLQPPVIGLLQGLTLPGNATELRGHVDAMVSVDPRLPVGLGQVPRDLRVLAARRTLSRYERAELHALLQALDDAGGNRSRAAALLGVSRSTLYRKLDALGVDLERAGT